MILVTGGAGFIGSNLHAALAGRGLETVIVDRLRAHGKWRNLAHHAPARLIGPAQLDDFLATHPPVEAVFHLGAISSTTAEDGDLVWETNVELPLRLWHWCAARGVRFIYASSAATYGDGALGFEDDIAALDRLRPLNLYGWTKHAFDLLVAKTLLTRREQPPQWAGLKFFNVYGPNEDHKGQMKSVAAHIWPDVAQGRAVKLFKSHHPDYADGGQLRDFVYVRDVAEVAAWLAGKPEVSGIFNVGAGRARSFKDLAEAVFKAAGAEPRIDYAPMPEELRGRYQYFTEARIDRLRAAGYDGQMTSLEDGMGDYVRGFLSQPDPYR